MTTHTAWIARFESSIASTRARIPVLVFTAVSLLGCSDTPSAEGTTSSTGGSSNGTPDTAASGGSTTDATDGGRTSSASDSSGSGSGSGSAGTQDSSGTTEPDAVDGTSTSGTGGSSTTEAGGPDECYVIYLSFDGETLVEGEESDSRTNTTAELFAREYLPYDRPNRDEILAATRDVFAPFNVCVADERPDDGDYHMVIVESAGNGGSSASPRDCDDQNPNDISSVSTSYEGPGSARIIARAVGSSVGLQAVDAGREPCEVMSNAVFDPDGVLECEFVDACVPMDSDDLCAEQHLVHCDPGQQNSFAALMSLWGPAAE